MGTSPFYIWALAIIGVLGFPAATAAALRHGTHPLTAAVGFGGLWLAWVAASAVLADAGAYRQSATAARPWIGVAAGGAFVVALLGLRVPAVRRALADPGALARLTWPHTLRVVGVAFVIAMALGKLPAVFALPAGLGDIAIGIAAPFAARRLATGDRRGAVWFNVLGVLDLVVALSLGFLAGLGPAQLLDVSPSTAQVALLPLALIPTTAVPLALALHVAALTRLRAIGRASVSTPPVPAVHRHPDGPAHAVAAGRQRPDAGK